jgi:hypothetical protein
MPNMCLADGQITLTTNIGVWYDVAVDTSLAMWLPLKN